MIELFDIPQNCICNITIPTQKFFGDSELVDLVEGIQWYASLKPSLINAQPVKNSDIRYEEIQILCLKLTDTNNLYEIVRTIFKQVKYPCLLLIEYENKFLCGCCRFNAGKIDYDNNILKQIVFSHWIHPDFLSANAGKTIENINHALNKRTDLYDIYTEITHSIQNFSLNGITKAHVERLLKDLLGPCSAKKRDTILAYCTPYKKYAPTDTSKSAKYDRNKRTSNYTYRYDIEDIWYCLKQYEPTNAVVVGRRYKDIEDLIYSIDSKLNEYNDWM